jgi:Acetylornithine deacetylase/Succinyl-diaminopimelate desuccinylase and related deacylases
MSSLQEQLASRFEQDRSDLIEFLRIPSVSALREHRADMHRAAEWLAAAMRRVGLENVQVIETPGHPIVYADWIRDANKPTALIYGHYDVQPVDPLDLWESPPFEPEVRQGRIYARGASDDKGQVMVHLAALGALLACYGELPVNVRVLIEGEEEVGSPSLEPFLQERPDLVSADFVVISDTSMFAPGLPTLCTGLRGIAAVELHVTTAATDLHSGLYGGAAPNALQVLAQLIAASKDDQGRVAVPGFYDRVIEPTPRERQAYAALPFNEKELLERLELGGWDGEPGYTPFERMTVRPTFEVNGMWGGFLGEGSKTVIPREAHAKITCRLVAGQDPEEVVRLLTAHFQRLCPPYARVEVTPGHGARPWKADLEHPALQAAIRALQRTFGKDVALAPTGGSIPVVESFDRLLRVPCVLMGFADPDSNAHAPNERFSVETFRVAREAVALFWQEAARDGLKS